VELNDLLPTVTGSLGTVTYALGILTDASSIVSSYHIADPYLEFVYNAVAAGQTATVHITIESENYDDIAATVTITTVTPTYAVNVGTWTGGTVTANSPSSANGQNVPAGETVTLVITPAAGYEWTSLTVDGGNVTASVNNNTYVFVMPAHNVSISAVFSQPPPSAPDLYLLQVDESTVRIYNFGNAATGPLTLSLSGAQADVFTLWTTNLNSLAAGDEVDVTITTLPGLPAGLYQAILTVTDYSLTLSVEINCTVTTPTGTEAIASDALRAHATAGGLQITGLIPGQPFALYNIEGQLFYKGKATATEARIPLRARGVYVVVSGKRILKAVYKRQICANTGENLSKINNLNITR
jgi:hypothetical protein